MTTRTRKPGAERREQIVSAVLEIVGEQGISALTTATLAEAVGVTSGALFRHFDSIDEMLEETARYAASRIDETFPDDALPASERLHRFTRSRVELLRAQPGIAWLLRSEQSHLALPPGAIVLLQKRVQRSRRFVLAALKEGMADGSVRDDVEPASLFVIVMGTIHTLVGRPRGRRKKTGQLSKESSGAISALMRLIAPCTTPGNGEITNDHSE